MKNKEFTESVLFSLTPEQKKNLQALSVLTGKPVSRIVREAVVCACAGYVNEVGAIEPVEAMYVKSRLPGDTRDPEPEEPILVLREKVINGELYAVSYVDGGIIRIPLSEIRYVGRRPSGFKAYYFSYNTAGATSRGWHGFTDGKHWCLVDNADAPFSLVPNPFLPGKDAKERDRAYLKNLRKAYIEDFVLRLPDARDFFLSEGFFSEEYEGRGKREELTGFSPEDVKEWLKADFMYLV